MPTDQDILHIECNQAVLQLEAAFLKAMSGSNHARVSAIAHRLGLTKLVGYDEGLALARGLAKSLENKQILTTSRFRPMYVTRK